MNILIITSSAISFILFRVFYFLKMSGNAAMAVPEVITKGITSQLFVLYALWNFYKNKNKSPVFTRYGFKIICGLSIAVLADISINLYIPAGMMVFLVMQIFYILAFREFKNFSLKYFIITVLVSFVFIFGDIFNPFFNLETLLVPIVIYTFFVIGSTVKSMDAFLLKNKTANLLPIASILFLVSDFILQLTLGDICSLPFVLDQIANNLCHLIYYVAQFIFAYTLTKDFFPENK